MGKADLSGCIMYTSAEPCPMCLKAIYWFNIAQVYHGNTKRDAEWAGFGDEFITVKLQKKLEKQKITFHGLLQMRLSQSLTNGFHQTLN
nr:hypothetical protein [Pedobacter sp. G11]